MIRSFWQNFRGGLLRVFPDALAQAQAAAFGMFLSFFPLLLFVLGVLSSSRELGAAVGEIVSGLRAVLPPGSRQMVTEFLTNRARNPGGLIFLGLGGTLLAGTQVMTGLMEGFRIVHRISFHQRPGYWRQQVRALLLLVVTIVPFFATMIITVFGRQLRQWMIAHFGLPGLFNGLWLLVYAGLALVVATLILTVIYRVGQRGTRSWNDVLPGAAVATLLWWVVNSGFGFYVRHVPYSLVYGGLAAAIGLLIWMNLSAVVILIGSAFNAERLAAVSRAVPVPRPAESAEPAPARRS